MATERIPLTQPIESRTGSFAKDSYSSNCFFESRDQKREFIKRPGLVAAKQIVSITPPAYTPSQGLVSFNNKLVAIINNTIYQINPSSSYTVSTLGTTSASTSQSYFVRTFFYFPNFIILFSFSSPKTHTYFFTCSIIICI